MTLVNPVILMAPEVHTPSEPATVPMFVILNSLLATEKVPADVCDVQPVVPVSDVAPSANVKSSSHTVFVFPVLVVTVTVAVAAQPVAGLVTVNV
jgi:hypothetical protein